MKGRLIILAAALGCLAACGRSEGLRTEAFESRVSYALAEGSADSIRLQVRIEYPVSGASEGVLDRIRATIAERTVGGSDLEEAARSYVDAAVADYRENAGDLLRWASEEGVGSGVLNWEEQVSGYVHACWGNLLSYDIYVYSFQGGAHGLSGDEALLFDLTDGHLVPEEEFFAPGFRDGLSALLSGRLRESLPDEDSYEALFAKDIEPNGNFRVSEAGVTYIYNPYSIGPYYLGIIEVTVPWEEVQPLLADGSPDV